VKGPLKGALDTANIADIMDFDMIPFGQGMWNTGTCGTMDTSSYVWGAFWEGYDANARLCYNVACGADHGQFYGDRPADCFNRSTGPYCQHGGAECAVNAIQACAKKASKHDWTVYGPLVVCFEENYASIQHPAGAHANSTFDENRTLAQSAIKHVMAECTGNSHIKAEEVLSCFHDSEVDVLAEMAAATVPHVTIPFVRIKQCDNSWKVLEIGDEDPMPSDLLVKAVCASACEGTTAWNKCSTISSVSI